MATCHFLEKLIFNKLVTGTRLGRDDWIQCFVGRCEYFIKLFAHLVELWLLLSCRSHSVLSLTWFIKSAIKELYTQIYNHFLVEFSNNFQLPFWLPRLPSLFQAFFHTFHLLNVFSQIGQIALHFGEVDPRVRLKLGQFLFNLIQLLIIV